MHYRDNSNPGQVKIQDLSKVKNFYVDRTIVTNWVAWGSKWASWVLIPIALVFSFIYRLIQGLIYGAIGMIFNNSFNAHLPYAALIRLSFVAVTPVMLLDTILSLANINVPAWSFICLAIAMLYLAMGVKANEQAPAPPAYGYGPGPYAPPLPPNPFQQQGIPQQPAPYQAPPQYPQPPQYPPNVR